MSVWGRIFAAGYDHLMSGPEKATLRPHREVLIPRARGRVLEIGGGTGRTSPSTATTSRASRSPSRRRRWHAGSRRTLKEDRPGATVLRAPAEDLPFEDDVFDTVISTLVLCTVDDQPRALRQLRRVLRPGGRLLFIEHVRADDARLARWQDRLNGLQLRMGHGCNCNRPTLETIAASGFEVAEVEHDVLRKAPPIVRPLIVGVAEADGAPV